MTSIDLNNIQGDILKNGFPKKSEIFSFFSIDNAKGFAAKLPQIDFQSTTDVQAEREKFPKVPGLKVPWPTVGVNIAFTFRGLEKLKSVRPAALQIDKVKAAAPSFAKGMVADRSDLSDPEFTVNIFKQGGIDGVLIVGGSHQFICQAALDSTIAAFNQGSTVMTQLGVETGKTRPGDQDGHEHFGYEDGISHPQVRGVDQPNDPESPVKNLANNFVDPGVVLVGRDGELGGFSRLPAKPTWMNDGAFFVFRKLEQDVAGWKKFVDDNASKVGMSSDKLGAKLIGRWKSGCPIEMNEDKDDPKLAFRNDFDFSLNRCPAGGHIRKTHIRQGFDSARIMRRGIPYGEEFDSRKPDTNRGLLFACYQSTIEEGYKFIQQSWANAEGFPASGTGLDVVFGQAARDSNTVVAAGKTVPAKGINPFVKARGGEYFFAPSISALKTVIGSKVA